MLNLHLSTDVHDCNWSVLNIQRGTIYADFTQASYKKVCSMYSTLANSIGLVHNVHTTGTIFFYMIPVVSSFVGIS